MFFGFLFLKNGKNKGIPESGVAGVLGVLGLVTCDKGVEAAEFDPPTFAFDKFRVT